MRTWGEGKPDSQVDAVRARSVLRDAYINCRDFQDVFRSGEIPRIRRSWVACVTLLRAVGHVLHNVDGARSEWIGEAVSTEYHRIGKERLGNLIFWEFIRAERNLVVKEYESSILERVPDPGYPRKVQTKIMNLLIGTDFFEPPDVLFAALQWWEGYLERVECAARNARRSARNDYMEQRKKKLAARRVKAKKYRKTGAARED